MSGAAGREELGELAAAAVEAALGAGAADAEAYATSEATREVRVHDGEVESLTAATERGLGIRAWIDHRVGYAFGTDLSADGLGAIARRAAEGAGIADPDEFAAAPDGLGEPTSPAGLVEGSVADWGVPRVVELALAVERSAREIDSAVTGVEQAVYADSFDRVAIATSTGIGGSYDATTSYAYAQALAEADGKTETGLGFGVARGPAGLDPEAIGREAGERAISMIGAGKPLSRSCPVLFDPTVASSFIGLIGSTLAADAVQRGRSPFGDRLGDEIAAAALVLSDDGLDPEGLASSPFDGEGTPRRRTPLIADRRLRSFLFDAYTARRGAAERTGSAARSGYRSLPSPAASNLVVEPGSADFAALLAAAGDGIYVTDVAGLHSGVNPVSGVFSVGASGRLISGGELAEPVREFTIASDLVTMLGAIAAVSSQPRWVPFGGSVSTPALLVGEMAVGGS